MKPLASVSNPDIDWLEFSRGYGQWSLESEERFERDLKKLAKLAKSGMWDSWKLQFLKTQIKELKNGKD